MIANKGLINNRKAAKKAIIMFIAMLLIIPGFVRAEDYPSEYVGPGYREYVADKIQNGYYVEEFTKIDLRQKERVNKRNQIEQILGFSSQAMTSSSEAIVTDAYVQQQGSNSLKEDIAKQRQQRLQAASAQGEFTYMPHSDGKIEYFTDGLVTRVTNEKTFDEFGNESSKNTYNMQYNDKRLLMSSESDVKDNLGNISRVFWKGTYTADSVFYASDDTNANKSLLEYTTEEIDHAGNARITEWKSIAYEGKCVSAFSQTISDSIYGTTTFVRSDLEYENNDPKKATSYHEEGVGTDGLSYILDRTNIEYKNKDQVTVYDDELTTIQLDGSKSTTKVHAKLKYLSVGNDFGDDTEAPPDRLFETAFTTLTKNVNGSFRVERTVTTNTYDESNKLIGATAKSEFSGKEEKWYDFKDSQGNTLTRTDGENGTETFSYIDADTKETVVVAPEEVITTLRDGSYYEGTQETAYEVLFGKLLSSNAASLTSFFSAEDGTILRTEDTKTTFKNGLVNNIQKLLSSEESTKIAYPVLDPEDKYSETGTVSTTYFYDSKGNLTGASGTGNNQGHEYRENGWAFPYTSIVTVDYEVILGKPLEKSTTEEKTYN
jgi:hypothetical protein